MPKLHDAHLHLDFAANAREIAMRAASDDLSVFANTVVPEAYARTEREFADFENICVGWGFHPWWVDPQTNHDGIDDIQLQKLQRARFVGEVGLDFSKRHEATKNAQLEIFSKVARTCAEQGGKVLSIHAVKSAREVLDVLENSGALSSCTCIFHWYSGPSDQLKRAKDAGCLFSIGPRMMATKKGREYVKAIPTNQLLLETDLPAQRGDELRYEQLWEELSSVCTAIAAIKGPEATGILEQNAARVFK